MIKKNEAKHYQLLPINSADIMIPTRLLLNQDNLIIANITCAICSNIPNTPLQCKECNSLFCNLCIKNWMSRDANKCWKCKKIFRGEKISRMLKNIIDESLIKCVYVVKGCEKNMAINFLLQHLEECKYTSRKAKCIGCEKSIDTTNQKKEIKFHVSRCEDITVPCQFCFLPEKRRNMGKHLTVCKEKPTKCEDCQVTMKLIKLDSHTRKECAAEIIRKYEKIISEMEEIQKQDKEKIKELELQLMEKNAILDSIKIPPNPNTTNIYSTKEENRKDFKDIQKSKITIPDFSVIRTIEAHSSYVWCLIQMNWSKDEVTIVSGSTDNTIKVWNITDGTLIRTLQGHSDYVRCLIQMKWSKDDTTILSGSSDNTIKIWNVADGTLIKILQGHSHWIRCLIQMKWSKDETTIVSGSKDSTMIVWNISDGALMRTLQGHSDYVRCLIQMNWSMDDTTIVSGSSDNTMKVWNVENGSLIRTLQGHSNNVRCLIQLKWSKDDTTIVSGSNDFTIKVWNAANGTLIRSLLGHSNDVLCLIQINWSKDENIIISGSNDHTIKIWNASDGTLIRTLQGHSNYVSCLIHMKWSKDETTIISGSGDKTIKVWNKVLNNNCLIY